VNVAVGQVVQTGTVLATLNESNATTQVAQAQSALTSAENTLAQAQNPATPQQISAAQLALASARTSQADVEASVQALSNQDSQIVQNDQNQIQSVNASLTSNGCATTPTTTVCTTLQSQLSTLQGQLALDIARSNTDATGSKTRLDQAQATVNAASSALSSLSLPIQSQISSAQAQVSAATAALANAQANLAQYQITAPFSGVVLAINGSVGQTVPAGTDSGPTLPGILTPISTLATASSRSNPVIVLGATGSPVVAVTVPSNEISSVVPGQAVSITDQSALTGKNYEGKVLAISRSSYSLAVGVNAYYVTISVTGSDRGLTVGDSASVNISVSSVSNVLSVPVSAVYYVSGQSYVDVWNGHAGVATSVSLGAKGSKFAQVLSGLRSGEEVVLVANQGFVQAGIA
jgi:macrolide-specific efflux system membrane fusion protein